MEKSFNKSPIPGHTRAPIRYCSVPLTELRFSRLGEVSASQSSIATLGGDLCVRPWIENFWRFLIFELKFGFCVSTKRLSRSKLELSEALGEIAAVYHAKGRNFKHRLLFFCSSGVLFTSVRIESVTIELWSSYIEIILVPIPLMVRIKFINVIYIIFYEAEISAI